MKRKVLHALLLTSFLAFIFILSSCGSSINSNNDNVYYTITFKNYNGEILQTSSVKKGEIPTYNKSNPTRDNDDNYSYTFNGWNPSIETVSKDMVYTATYISTKNSYTVTWKNWDDTILEVDYNVEYGKTPTYNGSTPTRQSNQNNNYVFNGWDKIITTVTKDIEYTATFEAVPVSLCIVNFDSKGGTSISSQSVIKGEKIKKPSNPTKEGYTFDDWYYQGERWSFIGYTVTENMTLEARWNINSYTLSLSSNNTKAGTIYNNGVSHNYNESITITATTNLGYTFIGWYDGDNLISEKPSYAFTMPAKNLSYTAKFSANTNTTYKVEHYLQNIDNNNYTLYETDNITGTTDTQTAGSVKTYEGFTSPSITQVNISGNGQTVIVLYYTRNSYAVELSKSIDKAGTITGAGTYKYGKEVTITALTNTGYTFNGWYKNDKLYIEDASFDYTIGAEAVAFEARYTANKYMITIDNQAEGVTISGITSGEEYVFDTEITLTATNIPYGCTIKWVRSDDIVLLDDSYVFNVPASNIKITTNISYYKREDSKIYFGTYPQTNVEPTSENGLSSIVFDSTTWISYKYYISSVQKDYMYYKDVDIDNNGTLDYRGVYFTEYRPRFYSYSSSADYSYQDENGYTIGKIYWFSYDPIEWNILKEDGDKALIISNLVIDSQEYYPGNVHSYELSTIRAWLCDTFYNTAFNIFQKSLIEEIIVDNSEETSSSLNISSGNNTNDKIFLLSYQEANTYFTTNKSRIADGTDYSKCQGLPFSTYVINCVPWRLRTSGASGHNLGYTINYVTVSGAFDGFNIYSSVDCGYSSYTACGVRPACWINLKSKPTNTAYKVEHYQQNIDESYSLEPYETDNLIGISNTLTNGRVKTYEGFTSPSISQVNIKADGSTVIKLYYTRNSYTVSLSQNNEKAGTILGAGTYKYCKEITITAETNSGYTFNGWYLNDSLYVEESSFTYKIGVSSIEFEARYIVNKYTITLDNQAEGVSVSGITSGNEFEFDTEITLISENNSGLLLAWTVNGDILHVGNEYSFNVPSNDITIITTTSIYVKNNKKIYFGTYPQTKVEATTENGLASITFDSSTWISYKYYISSVQTDFMYYKDVDIDNNGTLDYRGVYFSQYRPKYTPYSSTTGNSYQDDYGYTTSKIYWFSYDPIEWNILKEENCKILIIANLILDSQEYNSRVDTSKIFEHNGGTGYSNNYELSDIRKWLNDNFYNTAFDDLQKALIEETTVDNSASTTASDTNEYACNDTEDKLFLLSYQEANTYFSTNEPRIANITDYSRCQGLKGYWWLRSPDSFEYGAKAVYSNGISHDYVGYTNGVRPACWINL